MVLVSASVAVSQKPTDTARPRILPLPLPPLPPLLLLLLLQTTTHSQTSSLMNCSIPADSCLFVPHEAVPRHDRDRPTRCLPSGRRVTADVRVTGVERVHHSDGPPTRRRISPSQQEMWLLPTRLRSAVTGGRRSTVRENTAKPAPHTVIIIIIKNLHST